MQEMEEQIARLNERVEQLENRRAKTNPVWKECLGLIEAHFSREKTELNQRKRYQMGTALSSILRMRYGINHIQKLPIDERDDILETCRVILDNTTKEARE